MGNASILHGFIESPNETAKNNAACITALPREDGWPYLTSDLFAVPQLEHTYNETLISFGTIYKNLFIEHGWPEWKAKFETLLRTMSWYQAHVYLDVELVGRFHFVWTQDMWRASDYDFPTETEPALAALREAIRSPTEKWIFSGGPVQKSEP